LLVISLLENLNLGLQILNVHILCIRTKTDVSHGLIYLWIGLVPVSIILVSFVRWPKNYVDSISRKCLKVTLYFWTLLNDISECSLNGLCFFLQFVLFDFVTGFYTVDDETGAILAIRKSIYKTL